MHRRRGFPETCGALAAYAGPHNSPTDGERDFLNTDLGLECGPLLPIGWVFELRLSRNTDGDFGGIGLLRRHGVDMCHLTLASLASDRTEALRRVKSRVESWMAEWEAR
jgi:hypothetical protein